MENIQFLTFDTSEAAIGTKGFGMASDGGEMGRGGREMESEGGGMASSTGRDDQVLKLFFLNLRFFNLPWFWDK